MVCLKRNRQCFEFFCEKVPSCNYPTEKSPVYCCEHKKEGMVNIVTKRCRFLSCDKFPTYGWKKEKMSMSRPLYCSLHKEEGMELVISKSFCHYQGKNDCGDDEECKTIPYFNYPGVKPAIFCSKHKMEGMVNVLDKYCLEPDCNRLACCNYKDVKSVVYCIFHKRDGMIKKRG